MLKLYAIRDIKAESLVGGEQCIVAMKHDAPAVRMFNDVAGNPQTLVHRHAEDFELVCLGEIVDDAVLRGYDIPRVLVTGTAWLAAQNADPVKEGK